MTGTISTTARRITRELNSNPDHTTIAFDRDGNVVGRIVGQGVDISALDGSAYILSSRFGVPGRGPARWTQAQVQAALDEQDTDR